MRVFEVKSIEEAVELAAKFKRKGTYDWFRGQTKDWPPCSSLSRIADQAELMEKAKERQTRFFHWLAGTPGLKRLIRKPDAVWAIAQHHGIPTPLLDFSTEPGVAGFFAASNRLKDKPSRGCIYRLKTADLLEFWKVMRKCLQVLKEGPDIEFVIPRVPNLWRLEAQHGVFLYAPPDLHKIYPMDRILFPQSGLPPFPTEDDVYPKKKSQLELLLDRFFAADALSGLTEAITKHFPDADILRLRLPNDRCESECFVQKKLTTLPGWNRAKLQRWEVVPIEQLRETALGEIGLRIDLREEAGILHKQVAFGVRRAMQFNPNLRKKAVSWLVLPQRRLQAQLTKSLDWLWNGMRMLPYSDEDIAEAVGLCFALQRLGFWDAETSESAQAIANMVLDDVVQVEFSSWEGCYGRGYVMAKDLRKAVRADIKKHLTEAYRGHTAHIQPLLQMCSAPSRLFVFSRFARLFGRQIIPTQVLRPTKDACLFSPARLEGFSLP